jgi:hypothetical protein
MTMKKLIIAAVALLAAVAANAQGYFTFNVHDTSAATPSNVKFYQADTTTTLSAANAFIQVFAGPVSGGVAGLQPLDMSGTPLPLNGTGTRAGYPNPFSGIYTTTFTGDALVGYASYIGSSWATATAKSTIQTTVLGSQTPLQVTLAVAPNLPNEVALGVGGVSLVPEPATLALGLLGLGTLLAFRRRQ